ncbi:MAG: carboxylesterase/lipase family protein [Hyphomonas oceanitis]|uniref:carboxylesterase/lipase family protein n=1 Tax=Hyphomonas oceanitis TaxID=81033 RepID=UPI003002341B
MATKDKKDTAAVGQGIARRAVLKGSALLAGGLATACATRSGTTADVAQGPPPKEDEGPAVRAGKDTAIVNTQSGKVAGFARDGIFGFKGMPYGAPTGGENRFLPPKPPVGWTGVRSSRQYGPVCPQDKGMGRFNDEEAFIFQWNDSAESEDCLRLNVWTPGLEKTAKRPVMVWLHGGAFAAGSGHDLPAFDGESLSRRGDVIVVTLNHRLNLLGYLDLSAHGDKYAESGNVGMLDIVAALQWVRDNIESFGGDPGRVMIFGQSGGGAKVSTLMGMPAAKGLFHNAAVMSGSFGMVNTTENSRRLTHLFLKELGLDASSVQQLHTLPYNTLQRASDAVLQRENAPFDDFVDIRKIRNNLSFAPVVDGKVLPAWPFKESAPAISADVPMIIGTTQNEFVTGINNPDAMAMTEDELSARVARAFPGRAKAIIAAFQKAAPQAKPFELWSRIATGPIRAAAIRQAKGKADGKRAPAYLYEFTWQTPILDGRPMAFHCADIPFAFFNTDRCDTMSGGGAEARALSATIADAFIHFARTGDPNHDGLVDWPVYESATSPTIMFGEDVKVSLNGDGVALSTLGDL